MDVFFSSVPNSVVRAPVTLQYLQPQQSNNHEHDQLLASQAVIICSDMSGQYAFH